MTNMQKLRKQYEELQPLWEAFEELPCGWNIRFHEEFKGPYNNEDYLEIQLEAWSPAGEDIVEILYLSDNYKPILEQLHSLVEDYDWEEHVECLIPARGTKGIPKSIMTLVKDAQEIGEMYKELYETAKKILSEE